MKKIIVKYGGSLLDNAERQKSFLAAIAYEWKMRRIQMCLVHGGGKEISRQMEKAGLVPKFINGRRFTDAQTMNVVEQSLKDLNSAIVAELNKKGANAIGYSGKDHHWLKATAEPGLGQVGIPKQGDKDRLSKLVDAGRLPVFYSVGEDANGLTLNINADDFAMILAIALGADELIFLTDVGGVLDKKGNLIPKIDRTIGDQLKKEGTITGGMAVKIDACFQSLSEGVGKVIIGESVISDKRGFQVSNGTEFL
jgi:acetylglutamate kinase